MIEKPWRKNKTKSPETFEIPTNPVTRVEIPKMPIVLLYRLADEIEEALLNSQQIGIDFDAPKFLRDFAQSWTDWAVKEAAK